MNRTSEFLSICISRIVSTQFIIAFSVLSLTFETVLLVNQEIVWHTVFCFVFFGSLGIYNLALSGFVPFSNRNNIIKTTAYYIAPGALTIASLTVFILPFLTFILALFGFLLSLLYLYPIRLGIINLQIRNIPLVKNLLLSIIWGIVTVLIPLSVFKHQEFYSVLTLELFFKRFFFILALAIVYDIRDFKQDSRNNLHTLPVTIGISKSKFIALLSLLVFVILIMLHESVITEQHPFAWNTLNVAFYFSILITAIIVLLARLESKKYYYALLLDGTMIMQFIIVLLTLKIKGIPHY